MTEIRNVEQELSRFRLRLAAAALFVVICFGLLLARFFWLQEVKHEQYSAKAEDNRISVASNGHGRRVTVNVKVNGLPATDWVWRWCGAQALGGRSTVHLRETHLSGPRRRLA